MSRHFSYAPGKRDARIEATPTIRAVRDRLFSATVKNVAARGRARLADGIDTAITPAVLDYFERKRAALKASYFRQRYGRDYWTGIPRHTRHRAAMAD